MLADIFNKRVVVLETQEGSAYGAALLAVAGSGEYASVPEACRAAIREVESVCPDQSAAALYRTSYETFKALYPALKPLYPIM
jgi:xylulokinase